MILKEADDRSVEIEKLREWSHDARIPEDVREKLEADWRRLESGARGEESAAYFLNFSFRPSRNWVLIHDLRLELNGRTAQIDHLLINRVLECYVMETKCYNATVSINERDEFTCHYPERSYGIESPHEQNRRHIQVLEDAASSGMLDLPKRLGFALKPDWKNTLLFSPKSRIQIAPGCEKRWKHLIKADVVHSWIDRQIDEENPILSLGSAVKLVSPETLERLGRSLVALHQPVVFNPYEIVARYGLSRYLHQVPGAAFAKLTPASAQSVSDVVEENTPCCQGCGATVEPKVVSFCRLPQGSQKFGGKILCRVCQSGGNTPSERATVVSRKSEPLCDTCGVVLDAAVVRFCEQDHNRKRFGGKRLCRTCQPK